jgi:hypothetical protein
LRFFLISVSRVPALRAMISGAASGSWAMGEPHSEQKRRWTSLPELPLPVHFLTGPLMVSLSLGTTATRAVGVGVVSRTLMSRVCCAGMIAGELLYQIGRQRHHT